ncbi:hypothetical protein GALMADRAFT_147416 [Galerina marginata CBS 339.88]|uniref:Uncharacterized protein n=1 Tax=Galerina marginata (strain CBS 339.88) TaxID=685588 RepID=A0A067SGZ3_GALM3|nr:hypothetical protein GALMADRAFT_147416 [Galerina marginata CBS 339.88]
MKEHELDEEEEIEVEVKIRRQGLKVAEEEPEIESSAKRKIPKPEPRSLLVIDKPSPQMDQHLYANQPRPLVYTLPASRAGSQGIMHHPLPFYASQPTHRDLPLLLPTLCPALVLVSTNTYLALQLPSPSAQPPGRTQRPTPARASSHPSHRHPPSAVPGNSKAIFEQVAQSCPPAHQHITVRRPAPALKPDAVHPALTFVSLSLSNPQSPSSCAGSHVIRPRLDHEASSSSLSRPRPPPREVESYHLQAGGNTPLLLLHVCRPPPHPAPRKLIANFVRTPPVSASPTPKPARQTFRFCAGDRPSSSGTIMRHVELEQT